MAQGRCSERQAPWLVFTLDPKTVIVHGTAFGATEFATMASDVGSLMLKYGGGGHRRVGTCQVPIESWQIKLEEIVSAIKSDG